jgi:hypothetical protein
MSEKRFKPDDRKFGIGFLSLFITVFGSLVRAVWDRANVHLLRQRTSAAEKARRGVINLQKHA